MTALLERLRSEPAMVASTILAALALIGVRLSEDDASALSQAIVTLGPLLSGLVIRSKVSPSP